MAAYYVNVRRRFGRSTQGPVSSYFENPMEKTAAERGMTTEQLQRLQVRRALGTLGVLVIALVWWLWPAGEKVLLQTDWRPVPNTVTVEAVMTATNVSNKRVNQVLTICTITAGGKVYKDRWEGGVLNGGIEPRDSRTFVIRNLGMSPTGTDNVSDVQCRVRKVMFD